MLINNNNNNDDNNKDYVTNEVERYTANNKFNCNKQLMYFQQGLLESVIKCMAYQFFSKFITQQ